MSLTRVYENKKYIEVMKRGKLHPKICYYYKNKGLFGLKEGIKLIIMSDIHSITSFVIDDMIKKKRINKETIVITTGDMAGDGSTGGNGDPYDDYIKILDASLAFYFVQGNHDYKNKKCKKLINKDGSKCCVEGFLQDTMIGTITGINGIEVKDEDVNKKLHKYSSDEYQKKLEYVLSLKPDILLTHQPINKKRLNEIYLPKIHLCGHYHMKDFFVNDKDYCMINLDGKIMEFV
jgi:predicted MPP superfamily phosphohydrolase